MKECILQEDLPNKDYKLISHEFLDEPSKTIDSHSKNGY